MKLYLGNQSEVRRKNQNTLNKQLYNDTIHQNNTLHIKFCVFLFLFYFIPKNSESHAV